MTPFTVSESSKAWWKEATVYQIYPASFCDSNADGVGDLAGITSKLDHIKSLGVDVIWLSPIYESPQIDLGYDISDYRAIHKPYGTMTDFKTLLDESHKRGLKLIMDLVVNHTSDLHEWFQASKSAVDDPKRDWYIWKKGLVDPETGEHQPPNNWVSFFGGSAWTYDEKTEEYYLRLFCSEQPDLNWENPEVREAIYDMMRFWLDMGIDGFRMDVINLISKVPGFPDAKVADSKRKYQPSFEHTVNGPRVHEFLKEMNAQVLSKYDILTVGEMPCMYNANDILPYVKPENKELNMVFHFELADMDGNAAGPLFVSDWKLSQLKEIVGRWQKVMIEGGGWNSLYLENHDQARSITRLCSDAPEHRAISGKLLTIFHSTLCGTPYIYQGQETGQVNMPEGWGVEEFKDVASVNFYNEESQRRTKAGQESPDMKDVLKQLCRKARDNARTPMQWDESTPNAGFTGRDITPWMRVHDDAAVWNVQTQSQDPKSVLNFWRRAIALRKQRPVLIYGNFTDLAPSDESVFAYTRSLDDRSVLVLLNFTALDVSFRIPLPESTKYKLILANYDGREEMMGEGGVVDLLPFEGMVWETETH